MFSGILHIFIRLIKSRLLKIKAAGLLTTATWHPTSTTKTDFRRPDTRESTFF
jgi:hypothetical protein